MTINGGFFLLLAILAPCAAQKRSFQVDYDGKTFLKDGVPFQLISGAIHYFRIPRASWRDRLLKAHAAGLNAVETYIPWNYHEPEEGKYNFDRERDAGEFLRQVHSVGLLAIVRIGPYICAEVDMGGLPAWLLRANESIKLRTSDPRYLMPASRWFSTVLDRVVRPSLYDGDGRGPVVAVQIENEYGYFDVCDSNYMLALHDIARKMLSDRAVLFTVDPPDRLKCGAIPSLALATVDFGVDYDFDAAFSAQRNVNLEGRAKKQNANGKGTGAGPEVNMEFYTGWLDHWRSSHEKRDAVRFALALQRLLERNASVNLYMFAGGSNFAYLNGASFTNGLLRPQLTSYDYDAPLSESGDTTWKYQLLRSVISKFRKLADRPVPANSTKHAYGNVQLRQLASLAHLAANDADYWLAGGRMDSKPSVTAHPQSMEQLGFPNGYVLYTSVRPQGNYPIGVLHFDEAVRDRAYVYDEEWKLLGVVDRNELASQSVTLAAATRTIHVLVENAGHSNVGLSHFGEWKGLVDDVTLTVTSNNSQSQSNTDVLTLQSWSAVRVDVERVYSRLMFEKRPLPANSRKLESTTVIEQVARRAAAFFGGEFKVQKPDDTFVRIADGWRKGQLVVNGVNLGRYWPAAGCPQRTLYVPASVLRSGENSIMLFELEGGLQCNNSSDCLVTFVAEPEIDVFCEPTQLPHSDEPAMSESDDQMKFLLFVLLAFLLFVARRRLTRLLRRLMCSLSFRRCPNDPSKLV